MSYAIQNEKIIINQNIETSREVISSIQPERMTDEMILEMLRIIDANLAAIQSSMEVLFRAFEEAQKLL